MKQLLIIFFFLLVIMGCSSNEYHKTNNDQDNIKPLSELINDAVYTNDTLKFNKICKIINDSIILIDDFLWFISMISIIPEKKEIFIDFIKEKWNPQINDNHLFKINIENEHLTLKNGTENNIRKSLDKYISGTDSTYYNHKIFDIKYFGKVKLSQIGTLISVKFKKNQGLTNNEYKLLFKYLKILVSYYYEKLDEISIKKWGVKFNSLDDYNKIISISEYFKFRIFIKFKVFN